jgi:hypothetical protein
MARLLFAPFGRDPIIRLIVMHWILGALTGIGCAVLLLVLDVGGLRSLLLRSDFLWLGLLLLCSGFAVTFGGVVSASAVMMVPTRDNDDPETGLKTRSRKKPHAARTAHRTRNEPLRRTGPAGWIVARL